MENIYGCILHWLLNSTINVSSHVIYFPAEHSDADTQTRPDLDRGRKTRHAKTLK